MENYFANNIKFLRTKYNLDQKQFGAIFGKSYPCISMWELGKREPKTIDAIMICKHFNINIDDLIGTDLSLEDDKLVLTDEEILLIKNYRQLNDEQKQVVKNLMGAF